MRGNRVPARPVETVGPLTFESTRCDLSGIFRWTALRLPYELAEGDQLLNFAKLPIDLYPHQELRPDSLPHSVDRQSQHRVKRESQRLTHALTALLR